MDRLNIYPEYTYHILIDGMDKMVIRFDHKMFILCEGDIINIDNVTYKIDTIEEDRIKVIEIDIFTAIKV